MKRLVILKTPLLALLSRTGNDQDRTEAMFNPDAL
jgi:hypothetical protein